MQGDEKEPYPQSEHGKPGTWREVKSQGELILCFTCPRCGQSSLLLTHTVDPDGVAQPTFLCPYECGFQDLLELKGWRAP